MEAQSNGITFREMVLTDIETVYGIECSCFSQPWSVESLINELTVNDAAYYAVAEFDGRVIGYAGMWVVCDEAHMTNIAVDADYRRRGAATGLILHLMRTARSRNALCITLEVRETNHRAQRVYNALGFRYAGTRRRYYSDTGENALILWNDNIDATLDKFSTNEIID
ncbi:MAG: ribosomal protein S18-alanine N-acetyltransferase [Clostridium sp.]|nr:ribosomal protein S18-alanine N-acetyltransferase [Clostridium sp.]MDY5002210.1 ribosomal protein S18-alanine N-acetyltransferase [Eubacteriales bacterium]MDY5756817.1 ribosomal protein S18-alanine N-acetyltransferase [Eubacteriales bacterium]